MKPAIRSPILVLILGVALGILTVPAPAHNAQAATATPEAETGSPQRSFATAEEAAAALKNALRRNDTNALLDIFGHDHPDLVLGVDPATARVERRTAATEMEQKLLVQHDGDNRVILVLGKTGWPLPIPLIRQNGRWTFDTGAGEQEILARRIGRDEIGAIEALKAFVEAQKAYAARQRAEGKPVSYARYVQSTPGQTDGLWWDGETAAKAGPSPLAKFVEAQREFLKDRQPGDAFHGYFFRVLTGQGTHAPGGAMSYLVDNRMTQGFAMLAWPADYRVSGVMTFLVGEDGRVLQKDLGEDTFSIVNGTRLYDPDESWKPAEPSS